MKWYMRRYVYLGCLLCLGAGFFPQVGLGCDQKPDWEALSQWMKKSLRLEQLQPWPYAQTCDFPSPESAPQKIGNLLFQYLWFETQMKHISDYFKRGFSPQAENRHQRFKELCMKRFPQNCGIPLQHRLELYAKHEID